MLCCFNISKRRTLNPSLSASLLFIYSYFEQYDKVFYFYQKENNKKVYLSCAVWRAAICGRLAIAALFRFIFDPNQFWSVIARGEN